MEQPRTQRPPGRTKYGAAPLDVSLNSVLTSFKMEECAKSTPIPADTPCARRSLDTETFRVSDPSGSTIQRQRRELQLLMAELKDRDKELNTMAASHHKQLHAWEQDRQKMLRLEQRCARLDDELQKRNEVIRVLTKRVWMVETREDLVQKELRVSQQQLSELEEKQQHISQKCQDFEEKNQSLNSTLMALSSQVGSLQVREEELSSMLKLKDKDVTEASSQVLDLSGRLRDLETILTESRSQETKLLRDLEESKRRYREARHEITRLKEELQQQVAQSSTQREEMIRLKQELQLLHTDLALSGEGDSWKDELLELARSKQERTMSELCCLRQVCENQRNDLQLLQLNLESARESLKERTSQGLASSQEESTCSCLTSPERIQDTSASPAACLQDSVNGALSSRCTDGDVRLSSCSLQQLLDESRQVIAVAPERGGGGGAADALHFYKCHTCFNSQNSQKQKAGDSPPKASPQHGIIRPRGGLHADVQWKPK
ncbi:hypothetical protein Q5P01_024153 [Channa striata]|uniref:Coiled-coil domain-containing protein 62 n=1 Tax=Channa striata TaxID=64152 RepID=A0AA88LMT3_CHASR|nr:hypothetical protein Q5P01_024153 [Channa striata]